MGSKDGAEVGRGRTNKLLATISSQLLNEICVRGRDNSLEPPKRGEECDVGVVSMVGVGGGTQREKPRE